MAENSYTPTDGMASAARRALQWKKEGKRGGTRVGLARANQLANKESLSASTVLRMYSFFSRHEVDKKAQGFSSGEEGFPSPGRVAWDLWGGDAGASWSKQKRDSIMNDRMNKSVWSGVFFPADEPALVDITEEEDAPLDEPIAEEVPSPEAVTEAPAPVEEAVVEPEPVAQVEEQAVEEAVEDPQEQSTEEPVAVEEAPAEDPAPAEEAVEEAAPVEEAATEVVSETSAE